MVAELVVALVAGLVAELVDGRAEAAVDATQAFRSLWQSWAVVETCGGAAPGACAVAASFFALFGEFFFFGLGGNLKR